MKDKLSDAKDWLVETGGNVLSGLKDGLSEKWDSIGDWFQDLPNKISNAIPDLFNTGKKCNPEFCQWIWFRTYSATACFCILE